MKPMKALGALCAICICGAAAAASYPEPVEGDWIAKDFHFTSGETLPELRLHYSTVGKRRRGMRGA